MPTFPRFTAMDADPVTVAQRLVGQRLVRIIEGQRLSGIIVEVEAYLGSEDLAAHTAGGRRTVRNEAMYLPGGHAYVYFTYGMHHCLNVVCGQRDEGVAVLIRALEPSEGVDAMFRNRPRARRLVDLCSGPGKLTQSLQIDLHLNGIDLRSSDQLWVERRRKNILPPSQIERTRRIGLNSQLNVDSLGNFDGFTNWWSAPLRFTLKNSQFISR